MKLKLIAIQTLFIFLLSLIATTVFLIFFVNIKDIIINFFRGKQPKEDFEIEILTKDNFSENFLIELALLCKEKANKSKLKIEIFACYYLFSKESFKNIHVEEDNLRKMRIDFRNFDKNKKNVIIIYNKNLDIIRFIN